MMQEEELVVKDESKNENCSSVIILGGREILPFTENDSSLPQSRKANKYKYTLYEVYVAVVIMLSTISGGYLEGYTSPAIPYLLNDTAPFQNKAQVPQIVDLGNLTNSIANNSVDFAIPITLNISSESLDKFHPDKNHTFHINETGSQASDLYHNISVKSDLYHSISIKSDLNHNISINSSSINNESLLTTLETAFETSTFMTLIDTTLGIFPSLSPLESDVHMIENPADASWLGSLLLLGACVGAACSSWVVTLGRRHAVLISAFPRLLGWILIAAASSVYTIYSGRFLTGVSVGVVSSAAPIYISEVAHPSLRGSLSCFVHLGVNIGIFIAALFGTFLSWRGLAVLGAVTVILYFIPSLVIPNSPTWLVLKGKENEARAVLRKLRDRDYCVEEELQQIKTITENISRHKSISWFGLLTERRSLLPLSIMLMVTFVNRFSGYIAIITYCSTFLHKVVPTVSQYWAAVTVCLVQIFATLAAVKLVDNWGRRKLLLLSVSVMGGALVLIAICEGIISKHGGGSWLAILGTMIYVSSYSLGIGPLTWVLLGEMFPFDVKEKGSAIVTVFNWLAGFIVTKTYFNLEGSTGIAGTCLLYACVCLAGIFSIYFLVPETKGRTLSEIESHFNYRHKAWQSTTINSDQAFSSILDQEAATIDTYSTFH